jgi:tRNA1(Val) A37 N6-methylase TrmN6
MSNHTKEPWEVITSEFPIIVDSKGTLAICYPAHRIVQCVNACADMKDTEKEIAQLRADRAELLKLVNELYARIDCSMEKHIEYEELIKKMEVGE